MTRTNRSTAPTAAPLASAICQGLGNRYTPSPQSQKGEGMFGIILTMAVLATMGVAGFIYYRSTNVQAQVKQEQATITEAVTSAQRAWGSRGSYNGLSMSSLRDAGMLPDDWKSMETRWGTPVFVEPATIGGKTNAGMLVRYDGLSAKVCTNLASNFVDAFYDIRVNGQSVLADGSVDTTAVITQCGGQEDNQIEYVFHDGATGQVAYVDHELDPDWMGNPIDPSDPTTWTPPPPIDPTAPCVAPPNQVRNMGCPAGQQGAVLETRVATCPSSTGAYTWGAWTQTANTCTPNPAECPAPETRGPIACPSGFSGTRMEQRDCTSGEPLTWGSWYAVVDACYETVASGPEPTDPVYGTQCVAPANDVETRSVAQCPTGEYGTIEEERFRVYLCPYTYQPAEAGQWSAWGEVSRSCTTCPTAPATPSCPDDTTGVYSLVTTPGTFPTVNAAGCDQYSFTNTCTPCPAVPADGSPARACGLNETGTLTWAVSPGTPPGPGVSGTCPTAVEVGNCVSCPPAPATPTCPLGQSGTYTLVTTPGTAPTLGTSGTCPTYSFTNTCTPDCGPAPANVTETIACPTGQSGTQSRTHGWTAAPAPTCWTADAWSPISGTCTPCPQSNATRCTLTVESPIFCPNGSSGTLTTYFRENRVVTTCPSQAPTYTPWVNTNQVCNSSNDCVASCTPRPNDGTCPSPSGTYFRWYVSGSDAGGCPVYDYTVETCGSGTPAVCTDPTATNFNGPLPCAYPPSGSCPTQEVGQTVETSCPSGSMGSSSSTQTLRRTGNCPSGVFDGTYGPWSAIGPSSPPSGSCTPLCQSQKNMIGETESVTRGDGCVETRTRQGWWECPSATGSQQQVFGPWTPWGSTGGKCALAYVPPVCNEPPSFTTSNPCPPGERGEIVTSTRYICDAVGGLNTVTETISNTCLASAPPASTPASHCWEPGPLPNFGPGSQYLGPSPYGGGWWWVDGTGNVYLDCP